MKKIILYFATIFISTFLLTSCTKETEKMIIGSWKVSSIVYDDFDRVEGEGEIWSFYSDGTCKIFPDDGNLITAQYWIDNDELEIKGDSEFHNGDWHCYSEIIGNYHVLTCDKKNLKIAGTEEWSTDYYYDRTYSDTDGHSYSMTVEFIRVE